MIEHLENKHWALVKELRDLERLEKTSQIGSDKVQGCLRKARELVQQCVDESEGITFFKERERLVKIIDYWTNILFQKTGEDFSVSLIPSPVGLTWIGITWEKLQGACRARASAFGDRKMKEEVFNPEYAIPRNYVEGWIQQFLESDLSAMVLTGDAGVGKTFMICQMAKKSLENDSLLILPYDSWDLVDRIHKLLPRTERRLTDVVGQIIANDLGYGTFSALEKELEYIGHLAAERNAYLLVCLDSVERFESEWTTRNLLVALNTIVERFSLHQGDIRRVKLMMISLDSSWDWLGAEQLCSSSLFFRGNERARGASIPWRVDEYSELEFKEAYKKYTGYSHEEDSFEIVESICQNNPYLLRIAASLTQQNKKVTHQAVFNIFYEQRVLSGSQDAPSRKEIFLARFMQDYDPDLHGVPAIKVDINDPAYSMLSRDGILAQEMIQDPFTRIILKLKPKGLVEYLLERFSKSMNTRE